MIGQAVDLVLLLTAALTAAVALVVGLSAEDSSAVSTPTWLWALLVGLAVLSRLSPVRGPGTAPDLGPGRASRGDLLAAWLGFLGLLLVVYWTALDVHPTDTDEWLMFHGFWQMSSGESIDWMHHGGGPFVLRWGALLPRLAVFQLAGQSPAAMRMIGLLLHASNGVFVLALGRRVGLSRMAALAAALLFLLFAPGHEIITSFGGSVFAQAATLLLGALLLLERSVEPDRRWPRVQLAAGLVCGLLAIFSKEIALLFPVAIAAVGLAADAGGWRAAVRRRRLALLGATVVTGICLAVLFSTPLAAGGRPEGQSLDQRVAVMQQLGLGRLWTAFAEVLPRALAVPFSAEVLPGSSGPVAGILLCAFALLVAMVGLRTRPAGRVVVGLSLLVGVCFAPAFFEAAPHRYYLEDTRYFYLAAVGSSLLLAAALDRGSPGSSLRRQWPLLAGTVLLLAVNLATMPVVLGVRVWFGRAVEHASGEIGRELRARTEDDELFLVCSLGGMDRSGMEAALMSQILVEPARPRVHLLSGLRFRERVRPGHQLAGQGPLVRIRPGPRSVLLGWPAGREAGFGPLDSDSLWQLVSVQAGELPESCPTCRTIVIEFGDDYWVFDGELLRNVTFRSIVKRV